MQIRSRITARRETAALKTQIQNLILLDKFTDLQQQSMMSNLKNPRNSRAKRRIYSKKHPLGLVKYPITERPSRRIDKCARRDAAEIVNLPLTP
nr:hypothetical protein [uncultured Campylobacter sp.]